MALILVSGLALLWCADSGLALLWCAGKRVGTSETYAISDDEGSGASSSTSSSARSGTSSGASECSDGDSDGDSDGGANVDHGKQLLNACAGTAVE